MAKKKQAAVAAEETPKPEPLSREKRVRRAFAAQARAVPALVEFTEPELDGFAALVNEDGTYDPEIKEKFRQLWVARRDRQRAEAAEANPQAAKVNQDPTPQS